MTTFDENYIVAVFSEGDCWVLALELVKRYPHLTVGVITEEEGDRFGWCHAFAYDLSTDTAYDVFGAQNASDHFPEWDMFNWEDMYFPENPEEFFNDQERFYPEVCTKYGVTLATVDMPVTDAVA